MWKVTVEKFGAVFKTLKEWELGDDFQALAMALFTDPPETDKSTHYKMFEFGVPKYPDTDKFLLMWCSEFKSSAMIAKIFTSAQLTPGL